jgi:TolB-like protein/DNA-binding winged helix-turn-helix (wHTH) protein/Flp pilus assembly protein TadD
VGFECYRIGDLLLDAGTQEVTRNGTVVPVPRLSFKLLLSLARHAPNVVSTQQLETEVWAGLVVDRGTVNKRVLLLRKALGEDKDTDPYIAVIRGSGYRLIARVDRIDASPEAPAQEDTARQGWFRQRSSAIRTATYGLLGLVAVLALYHGFQSTFLTPVEPGLEGDATTHTHPMLPVYSKKSIAVLPFVDLSDGQIHQYLGDGIAEEVINLLADMDGLGVAARTSSFAFRDSSSTAGEIAVKLRVGTILEGSIRHSGERIRVTAQLIDTQTGFHIWSKNYDRTFDEVFEVQDDIAFNIAQSLKLTLNESGAPDSRSATTGDIEAFALYLKGRELFNDRIHLRTEGLLDALDYFSKAVKQDPAFARAHAGIASVYWLLTSYDDSLDKDAYFELAEASANFALEFNPVSTEALSTLASVHSARGEIEQAAAIFEQIRTIGSNDTNIDFWEAMLHIRLGYFDELIEPLTEVYRLDPFNEHIGWVLAAALNFSGKPAEAASILEGLQHFTYRRYVLGLTAINQKNYPQARELLRDARLRSGVLPTVYADLLVDALDDPSQKEVAARKFISAVAAGELTELVSFESLLMLGSPRAFDLGIDPLNDITRIQIHAQIWNNWSVAIRQDPRFKDWVEKLGYVDFWRKHGWPDRCRPTGSDDFECI